MASSQRVVSFWWKHNHLLLTLLAPTVYSFNPLSPGFICYLVTTTGSTTTMTITTLRPSLFSFKFSFSSYSRLPIRSYTRCHHISLDPANLQSIPFSTSIQFPNIPLPVSPSIRVRYRPHSTNAFNFFSRSPISFFSSSYARTTTLVGFGVAAFALYHPSNTVHCERMCLSVFLRFRVPAQHSTQSHTSAIPPRTRPY